jgi:hypothetical protein
MRDERGYACRRLSRGLIEITLRKRESGLDA